MLEKDARSKFCPFMAPLTDTSRCCITDECMAWEPTDNECINPLQPSNPIDREPAKYGPAGRCTLMAAARR